MIKHRSFRLTGWKNDSSEESPPSGAEALSHALVVAAAQQAVILILAALILDGGHILRICALAAVASWLCTLLIMLRRPKHPTTVDLAIIKYGFWPGIPIVLVVGSLVDFFVR